MRKNSFKLLLDRVELLLYGDELRRERVVTREELGQFPDVFDLLIGESRSNLVGDRLVQLVHVVRHRHRHSYHHPHYHP